MKTDVKNTKMDIISLFHISDNTTFIVCSTYSDYHFGFPIEGRVYKDDEYLFTITIEGFVLDNQKPSEDGRNGLTLWVKGHLDKAPFDFSRRMTLNIRDTPI